MATAADFRSVIERIAPPAPGVSARVRPDQALELRDRGQLVVVYGYEHEPYARILRDGTVQVNRLSPATYLNVSLFPTSPVPPFANPRARPQWRTHGHRGVLVWHDHRSHYLSTGVPEQVADPGRRTKVFDYEVPLRIDGHRGAIDGTLFWLGDGGGSSAPWWLFAALAVLVIALAVAAIALWRRRRGGPEDETGGDGPSAEAW